MDLEDPWNWDIDRVVRELCTEQRSWTQTAATRRMPSPDALERALREQEIDGSTLLREVDGDALKDVLGIKVFGQRGTMMQIIRELRRKSQEYVNWKDTYGSEVNLAVHLPHASVSHSGIRKKSESPTPQSITRYPAFSLTPAIDQHGANFSTNGQNCEERFFVPDRSLRGENWLTDSFEFKRRKVDLPGNELETELSSLHSAAGITGEHVPPPAIQEEDDYEPPPAFQATETGTMEVDTELHADVVSPAEAAQPSMKRKRIAPTLISSITDPKRDREIPTLADTVVNNDPQNIEPGIIYIGDDGRKRLIPIPVAGLDPDLPRKHRELMQSLNSGDQQTPQKDVSTSDTTEQAFKSARKTEVQPRPTTLLAGYLGKQKFSVDDIFYPDTGLGQELLSAEGVDGDLMEVTQGAISDGRRLYLQKLMKRYLRTGHQIIHRKGKSYIVTRPYATKLAPMHQAPSFTLFGKTSDGDIRVTRESLLQWPEVESNASTNEPSMFNGYNERRANFDLPDNLKLGGPSSYDAWDPNFLEKYRYIDGGDVVLPLYGDSDEEGEYDIETWNEIEEERGTLEKPFLPVRKRQLTLEEVNSAIDEAIALIVVKWKREKLPRRNLQAWKLWKKTEQDGNKRSRIREAKQHVHRINNERLPKMRHEISDQIWTSAKQVHKLTRIMEQSIFDREDLLWQISVMMMKDEPEKPPLHVIPRKPKRPINRLDEDEECIEYDTETETSYDELDDFIVGDAIDSASAGEAEQRRADDEADDFTVSDISVSVVSDAENSQQEENSKLVTAKIANTDNKVMIDRFVKPEQNKHVQPTQNESLTTPFSSLNSAVKNHIDVTTFGDDDNASQKVMDDVIDLTMLATDTSCGEEPRQPSTVVDLGTPQKPKRKLKLTIKREASPTDEISESIQISDGEDVLPLVDLPPYTDLTAIAVTPREVWENAGDRERLLIGQLYNMKPEAREKLAELFASMNPLQLWTNMCRAMQEMYEPSNEIDDMDNKTYHCLTGVIRLFEMYSDCRYRGPRSKLRFPVLTKILAKEELFETFHDICSKTLALLSDQMATAASDEEDSEPLAAVRRGSRAMTISSSSDEGAKNSQKLRKRKVVENSEARDLREQDRQRLQEQEERRRVLQQKLALYGSSLKTDGARTIINDAKHDDQGFIYVHDHIKQHIKDHQIDGIRFMWSQIVTGEDTMQGCLLAHTMGLGKTMQVITLLVAIAEAARSPDESVSSQIPPSLRKSQTLVLCPPGLIDNWMDELLLWGPRGVLGDYRKVDSSLKTVPLRLKEINSWHNNGGVLLLGYNMFRGMIQNERTRTRDPPLTPEQHAQAMEQLLEGPRIIVADEAHIMKNSKAKITLAASQFKSKSRIALTGSPLANNIEEYHTMINWVAPNYLGPISEFKAKYVEPIQQGLYCDSTAYERRRSLKMLGVLKEDLSPKVHRADVSVLRDDLKPKTEFVITVPLTELQSQAYLLYVRSMSGRTNELTKGGDLKQTTLWHWLGVLSLLCNHPSCFREKLSESKKDVKLKVHDDAATIAISDDDPLAGTTPVWKVGISEELIRQEMELFLNFGSAIDAVEHSYKVKVLLQILDFSRAAGDKVLVFSSSIPTLTYLKQLCDRTGHKYATLDGKTKMSTRQASTKQFNREGDDTELYLISTGAGGLGLNLPGANRVIIFDFRFNPVNEEQAVGRAYRIGQKKPVFVYRFVAGGTFEERIHNKAVFKMQLSSRVVDKKNPIAWATRQIGEFLFEPKMVVQQDLSGFKGMDPQVLDKILQSQNQDPSIRAIVMTDTFYRHDNEVLTAEEQKEVKQLLNDEQLKRSNPKAWQELTAKRARAAQTKQAEAAKAARAQMSPTEQAILASLPNSASYAAMQHRPSGASFDLTSGQAGRSLVPPTSPVSHLSQNARVHDTPSVNMPEMAPIAGASTRIRSPTPAVDSLTARAVGASNISAPSTPKNPTKRSDNTYDMEISSSNRPPSHNSDTFKTPVQSANLSPLRHKRSISAPNTQEDADKLLQTALSRASRKSDSPQNPNDTLPEGVIKYIAKSIRQVIEKEDPTQWPSKVQTIAQHLIQDSKLVGDILSKKISAKDVAAMNFASTSADGVQARLADDIPKSGNSNHRLSSLSPSLSLKATLPRRSKDSGTQNHDAKAGKVFIDKSAARRQVRDFEPKHSVPSSSQLMKLPEWALSRIKKVNSHRGGTSRSGSQAPFREDKVE